MKKILVINDPQVDYRIADYLKRKIHSVEVLSPEISSKPYEAKRALNKLCFEKKPYIIVGISLGGKYAQELHGYRKIIINPAFDYDDSMHQQCRHGNKEDNQFAGITKYDVDHTYAFFSSTNQINHEQYLKYYRNATIVDRDNLLNDENIDNFILPIILQLLEEVTNKKELDANKTYDLLSQISCGGRDGRAALLNLEDALTNILEDVATNYFRSLYEVRDFATDAFQKATREFVFDIEDIPYRNYTKFLDEQLHSYFEEEVKEKQFLTYAHAGSKMDPLHAMTILANMYARACGISLGDRTIAYDAAYAWLRRYNEEHPEENRWNKTDMFSEVIPYLIDDYESKRIEDYDISFWETEDEIKYAVEIIDMYDSDTMKALCWGLHRMSMKEQRKFLFQLEKVIVHEDNHVDTTERGIFFDQVEAEKAMLDWTLNNRGQLLCYIIRTVPRCEAFNEGLVKAIKASEHFIDDLRLKEFVYLPAGFKRKQHFNVGDDVKYIFYDGVNTVLHTSRIVQLPARSGEGILMSDGYQVPERYVFTNNV